MLARLFRLCSKIDNHEGKSEEEFQSVLGKSATTNPDAFWQLNIAELNFGS